MLGNLCNLISYFIYSLPHDHVTVPFLRRLLAGVTSEYSLAEMHRHLTDLFKVTMTSNRSITW